MWKIVRAGIGAQSCELTHCHVRGLKQLHAVVLHYSEQLKNDYTLAVSNVYSANKTSWILNKT